MKLAIPFEARIFLVVVLVGMISILVILDSSPEEARIITPRVIQGLQQPVEPTNTLIISGIDIGQEIGFKSPTITGNEFACLADRTIVTDRGRATAKYSLSLFDAVDGGCLVTFARPERGDPGLFMKCPAGKKIYDLTIIFEPSLDSDIEDDDELEDLIGERLPLLGMTYDIVKADIDTNSKRLKLRLLGPTGSLDFVDKYDDNLFSDDVRANGRRIHDAQIRIRGFESSGEFRISSLEYRLFPLPVVGKDVYVADHQGTKQHLRTPGGFLGDFDLLFKGIGGTVPSTPPPRPSYGGAVIAFDAVGDDSYKMIFTNNQGRQYRFPVITVEGGSLKFGDDDKDFFFTGAGAGPPFNIELRDLFAVTNRETRNGITNILSYDTVDVSAGKAYFSDYAGGSTVGTFDTTTGDGTVNFGGTPYAFKVDLSAPHSMTIDQDNDGSLGGEAEIVTQGGPRIDFAGGGSGRLEIDVSLFHDEAPAGGENINFAFSKEGSDIDVAVTSGIDLIKNDATGKNEGLSQFGVFVQLGNRNTANDLVFNMPVRGGQRRVAVSVGAPTGQAQGQVLVTCERSEFVKRVQATR